MKATFVSNGSNKSAKTWKGSARSFWRAKAEGKVDAGIYNVPSVKNSQKFNCYRIEQLSKAMPKAKATEVVPEAVMYHGRTYLLSK